MTETCKECGKTFDFLQPHLRTHNITLLEYDTKHGIHRTMKKRPTYLDDQTYTTARMRNNKYG